MFIQPIFNTVINIKVTQLKITVNKTYYYYYYRLTLGNVIDPTQIIKKPLLSP